jgi:hypothetical protein
MPRQATAPKAQPGFSFSLGESSWQKKLIPFLLDAKNSVLFLPAQEIFSFANTVHVEVETANRKIEVKSLRLNKITVANDNATAQLIAELSVVGAQVGASATLLRVTGRSRWSRKWRSGKSGNT